MCLTPCCSGRDNAGINFKNRAGYVPPLNNGYLTTIIFLTSS